MKKSSKEVWLLISLLFFASYIVDGFKMTKWETGEVAGRKTVSVIKEKQRKGNVSQLWVKQLLLQNIIKFHDRREHLNFDSLRHFSKDYPWPLPLPV